MTHASVSADWLVRALGGDMCKVSCRQVKTMLPPVDHVGLTIYKLYLKWWPLIFPIVLNWKLQSGCHSKDNTVQSQMQFVDLKLKIFLYFYLNKYRKLVKFWIFCGTQDQFLQIVCTVFTVVKKTTTTPRGTLGMTSRRTVWKILAYGAKTIESTSLTHCYIAQLIHIYSCH